tara:strand:- start:472 stop:666 length:195 start_codon:yes stop_codon:yes gene_type:complete
MKTTKKYDFKTESTQILYSLQAAAEDLLYYNYAYTCEYFAELSLTDAELKQYLIEIDLELRKRK